MRDRDGGMGWVEREKYFFFGFSSHGVLFENSPKEGG